MSGTGSFGSRTTIIPYSPLNTWFVFESPVGSWCGWYQKIPGRLTVNL